MKIKHKFKYHYILYFLLAISILGFLFMVVTHNIDLNVNYKAKKSELILYNDVAHNAINDYYTDHLKNSEIDYDDIIIPLSPKVRVTILDTTLTIMHDSFNYELVGMQPILSEELWLAKKHGSSFLARKAEGSPNSFIFYVKKYPGYYLRTGLECTDELVRQAKLEHAYTYIIMFLFLLMACSIFYATQKFKKPIKTFNQFVKIINSPSNRDLSSLAFPDDELGRVGKKILDSYIQYEKSKVYRQQMSNNVAHELKTPVTAIRGYLETIIGASGNMDKNLIVKFTEKAYLQTLRLSSLVNDVSTLNKLDERSDTFQNSSVVISQCINEIQEELAYKLEKNNTTLDLRISSDLRIIGCYTLIYSLFKNLIDNTIEHGGKNTNITISAGIAQIAGEGGYRIDFTYTDTGKGIPEENIPRIFERFYRIEEGRTRKTGGSGLGLAIVSNAILYHKGEISVNNRPEGGVIFKFSLYSLDIKNTEND